MNRIVIAVVMLTIFATLGCAKAPIIKRTAPGYFVGFNPLPDGEARLVLYRGAKFFSDGARVAVEVEECKFEIGIRQFAVCKVSPGRADITWFNALDTIDVPDGGWACAALKFKIDRAHFIRTDCRNLMSDLSVRRQVWTTQIPESEILEKEIVADDSRTGRIVRGPRRAYPDDE